MSGMVAVPQVTRTVCQTANAVHALLLVSWLQAMQAGVLWTLQEQVNQQAPVRQFQISAGYLSQRV